MTPGNTQKLRLWILPVPRPVKLNFFLYHCLSWIRVLIGCWITMWGWAEMFLLVESVTWHADSWAPTNTQTRNVDTHIVLVLVSGHVSESFNRSRSHWSSIIHQRLSFLYRDTRASCRHSSISMSVIGILIKYTFPVVLNDRNWQQMFAPPSNREKCWIYISPLFLEKEFWQFIFFWIWWGKDTCVCRGQQVSGWND